MNTRFSFVSAFMISVFSYRCWRICGSLSNNFARSRTLRVIYEVILRILINYTKYARFHRYAVELHVGPARLLCHGNGHAIGARIWWSSTLIGIKTTQMPISRRTELRTARPLPTFLLLDRVSSAGNTSTMRLHSILLSTHQWVRHIPDSAEPITNLSNSRISIQILQHSRSTGNVRYEISNAYAIYGM